MRKDQKGITLVALIITIIVMLILVAVTISIALNGGLFDKARSASTQTRKSQVKEAMALAKADFYAMYYDPDDAHYFGSAPENSEVQARINSYLYSEGETDPKLSVTVSGPTTNSNGATYTVTIDQSGEGLALDNTENTILLDMYKSGN